LHLSYLNTLKFIFTVPYFPFKVLNPVGLCNIIGAVVRAKALNGITNPFIVKLILLSFSMALTLNLSGNRFRSTVFVRFISSFPGFKTADNSNRI